MERPCLIVPQASQILKPQNPNPKSVREMKLLGTHLTLFSNALSTIKHKLGISEKQKQTRKCGTFRKHLGILVGKEAPPLAPHIKNPWKEKPG